MELTLLNPWGLTGLLSVPIIVLLHIFQRRTKTIVVSTLFLMPSLKTATTRGRTFTYFKSSPIFWLQILCALLLSFLLGKPALLFQRDVQDVIVVLDASASMSAYTDASLAHLQDIESAAAQTQWHLIAASPEQPTLYQGNDFSELANAFNEYSFVGSYRSPLPALRLARQLTQGQGRVIYVADHPPQDLPSDVEWLSIGEAKVNTGFTGMTIEQDEGTLIWKVLLRNYSDEQQKVTWHIRAGGSASEAFNADLLPGAARALSGTFPDNNQQITLVKEPDSFSLDDRLPIIRPIRKQLMAKVFTTDTGSSEMPWLNRLLNAAQVRLTEKYDADVVIYFTQSLPTHNDDPSRIVFLQQPDKQAPLAAGLKVLEQNTLTKKLDFNALITPKVDKVALTDTDTPLLWKEDVPIIFLRSRGYHQDLYFAVDPELSNLTRLPSFVILLNRYIESIRKSNVGYERSNTELGSLLRIPVPEAEVVLRHGGQSKTLSVRNGFVSLKASNTPGFFKVQSGKEPLLEAAAYFSDAREADLRQAESGAGLISSNKFLTQRKNSSEIMNTIIVILAFACLLGSWALIAKGAR